MKDKQLLNNFGAISKLQLRVHFNTFLVKKVYDKEYT